MNKDDVDVVAIYCPDTRCCYYIDPAAHDSSVNLRIRPTLNNNAKKVHWADNYLEVPSTLRRVAAG
jgi:hypothetical protein